MTPALQEFLASFAGCDNRATTAKIWICGLEWGGADRDNYYKTLFTPEGNATFACDSYDLNQRINGPGKIERFDLNFAKLYAAVKGYDVADYHKAAASTAEGDFFKMNLYPISFAKFDDCLWQKYNLPALTGLATKQDYFAACQTTRFPFFANWARTAQPDLIICTGISRLTDFIACFAGDNYSPDKIQRGSFVEDRPSNARSRRYCWTRLNDGQTLLVILPFLYTRNGLNSDHLRVEAGRRIADLLGNRIAATNSS